MLAKYLLCIHHVRGSAERPEDSQSKMMVFSFLIFLHSGKADVYTDGCERGTYYSRDKCKRGGGSVELCPGDWKNLHEGPKRELGFEG